MKKTKFVTLEEIVAIHHDQINRYGGLHGVREIEMLISAISRSQASFAGKDLYPSLFDKAAALLHSLIMNHPFVDGNKRTAVVAASRFLFVNNYLLEVGKKELVKLALNVESKKFDIDKISLWFKDNSMKIS